MKFSKNAESPAGVDPLVALRQQKTVLRSFEYAWEGLTFCFATQRHMRVHFAIMTLTLLAAWGLRVPLNQLLQILCAMAMVLIAEMINTAIENTIDLITNSYDTRAKIAKDVAAGAVMLAAAYSVVVAVLVFSTNDRLHAVLQGLPADFSTPHLGLVQIVVIGLMLLGVVITWVKKVSGRGTLWRGGMISGHSAFGFLIATSIAIVTRDLGVTALTLALAMLVAQSRIQARIHSPLEVLIGGLMGIALAFVLFMWPG
jgi:diacylglycerol kinase (ATP)